MRKIANILMLIFIICALPLKALAAQLLVPVGQVVGLQLENNTVTVAALEADSPAGELMVGDCILSVNGKKIGCAEDVRSALRQSDGRVKLEILRQGKLQTISVTPQISSAGPKLGIHLREGVTGIGTVTYYDPQTGSFATLGHGVNDPGGALVSMTAGKAYPARVISVKPGVPGVPGQLMGTLAGQEPVGTLDHNTPQGLFGDAVHTFPGEALPVGDAEQIRTGEATILSTISGQQVQEYSVEIVKVYAADRENGRNMLIRITDPTLLATTGGIVQGMSGSPIIQDGKLVGAVTHVLVNDPTTGYGIFIENMLDAAA